MFLLALASEIALQTQLIATIIIALFLFIILIAFLSQAINIIKEYERLVQFRLGRYIGAKGPGVVAIIPIIDRVSKVDLRERFIEIAQQTSITRDNAPVDIDFLIYYKVIDAGASVIQVQNFTGAAVGIATTTLRAVVGDIMLDEVLAKREQINQILRTKMDEVTERWGVKVTSVEIREIKPPRDVQEAMIRQMSAERSRRATVTEAEGKKTSAILVAEGDKQSNILKAEGDRQAAILRAEGFSNALKTIYDAAKGIDEKTMSLQYLETLKALGASPATKFIFPMEFTSIMTPIREYFQKTRSSESK